MAPTNETHIARVFDLWFADPWRSAAGREEVHDRAGREKLKSDLLRRRSSCFLLACPEKKPYLTSRLSDSKWDPRRRPLWSSAVITHFPCIFWRRWHQRFEWIWIRNRFKYPLTRLIGREQDEWLDCRLTRLYVCRSTVFHCHRSGWGILLFDKAEMPMFCNHRYAWKKWHFLHLIQLLRWNPNTEQDWACVCQIVAQTTASKHTLPVAWNQQLSYWIELKDIRYIIYFFIRFKI